MRQVNLEKLTEEFERYLSKHVITQVGEGLWVCKAPETSIWWFGVALGPSMISVWGDVDELMLRPYASDPRHWLRGLRPDYPDYPLGKAPSNMRLKKFYPELARAQIAAYREDGADEDERKFAQAVEDAWDGETQHSYIDAQCEAGDDEPHVAEDWTRGALISYLCLCWWAKRTLS
jgi:hypothetical protein